MASRKFNRKEIAFLSASAALGILIGVGNCIMQNKRDYPKTFGIQEPKTIGREYTTQNENAWMYSKEPVEQENDEPDELENRKFIHDENLLRSHYNNGEQIQQEHIASQNADGLEGILQDGRDLTKLDLFELYDLVAEPNLPVFGTIAANKQIWLSYHSLPKIRVEDDAADNQGGFPDSFMSALEYLGLHALADNINSETINSSSISMNVPRYLESLAAGVDPFIGDVPVAPVMIRPTLDREAWSVMKEDLDNGRLTAVGVPRENILARLLSHAYGETITHVWGEGLDLNGTTYDFVVNVPAAEHQKMYLGAADEIANHFDLSWKLTTRKVQSYVITQIAGKEYLLDSLRNADGLHLAVGVNGGIIYSNVTPQEFADLLPRFDTGVPIKFTDCDISGFYDFFMPYHFTISENGSLAEGEEESFRFYLAENYGLSISQHTEERDKSFLEISRRR